MDPRFRSRLAIIGVAVAACLAGPAASAEGTGTLTVRFTGLVETGGVLIVTLADSRELFESEEEALRVARIPVRGAEEVAVFEPTHGSVPKYAELDPPIVNPIAMILAAAMMVDHVGTAG